MGRGEDGPSATIHIVDRPLAGIRYLGEAKALFAALQGVLPRGTYAALRSLFVYDEKRETREEKREARDKKCSVQNATL